MILYSDYMLIIALISPMVYNLMSLQGHRSTNIYFIFTHTMIKRSFKASVRLSDSLQ